MSEGTFAERLARLRAQKAQQRNDQKYDESDSDSDAENALPDTARDRRRREIAAEMEAQDRKQKPQLNLRKASRNAPTEMSSRVPMRRRRGDGVKNSNIAKHRRDPRFDPSCGNFRADIFDDTYGTVIKEKRQQEFKQLQTALKKTKSLAKREELKQQLQQFKNEEANKMRLDVKRKVRSQVRKTEIEQIKQGKRPYFPKRREIREMELAERFAHLQKAGKLSRFVEKRRKKNKARDARRMPQKAAP
ncbi:MAG: hypothetical protein MHM6MM_004106 [Cercozoa sp. M6MM]